MMYGDARNRETYIDALAELGTAESVAVTSRWSTDTGVRVVGRFVGHVRGATAVFVVVDGLLGGYDG